MYTFLDTTSVLPIPSLFKTAYNNIIFENSNNLKYRIRKIKKHTFALAVEYIANVIAATANMLNRILIYCIF